MLTGNWKFVRNRAIKLTELEFIVIPKLKTPIPGDNSWLWYVGGGGELVWGLVTSSRVKEADMAERKKSRFFVKPKYKRETGRTDTKKRRQKSIISSSVLRGRPTTATAYFWSHHSSAASTYYIYTARSRYSCWTNARSLVSIATINLGQKKVDASFLGVC